MKYLWILAFSGLLTGCGFTVHNPEDGTTGAAPESQSEVKAVEEHYPSGTIKIKGNERDGKRIGKWEAYYPNGYRWSETSYKNGIKEGDVVAYYKNGMMRYEGNYYNDERSGLWTFYDTSGTTLKRIDMDLNATMPDSLRKLLSQ